MKKPEKILALFDFDGTLLKEDSFVLFMRYQKVTLFSILSSLPLLTLCLIKRSIKFGYKQALKEALLYITLKKSGTSARDLGKQFSETLNQPNRFVEPVFEKFLQFKSSPLHEVCIVSASPDIWIEPLAKNWGVSFISTLCEIKSGKFTGRFIGKNCNGKEKESRLNKTYRKEDYAQIIAFGNNLKDDIYMFNWATTAYLVKQNQLIRIK